MPVATSMYARHLPRVYIVPTRRVCLLDSIFFEIYAIAVILVARGQGLRAVIKPMKNAATKGIWSEPIACMKDI